MAWYKCKVIFVEKIDENGERKEDVKEQYAVEAVSVTDAATIIAGHLDGFNFSLEEVTKMQIKEAFLQQPANGFRPDGYPIFIAKLALTTTDDYGIEKKQGFRYMIEERTFEDAYDRLQGEMISSISDIEIISISLSPIVQAIEAEKKEGAQ
jgi:hypothetical protein